MKCVKNDIFVHYPVDNLCLYEHSSSQPSFYTLYSVINHNGSLDDGHYTTFARDISLNSELWFEFDDETIDYLPTDQLNQNSKAYILFYILKQTSKSIDTSF
jgi:ubiquitin C-terminal hydrolase